MSAGMSDLVAAFLRVCPGASSLNEEALRAGVLAVANEMRAVPMEIPPSVRATIQRVCFECEVTPFDLLGKDRRPMFVKAREAVIARLDADGYSSQEIGRFLQRDHSTVLYHLNGRRQRRDLKAVAA